MQATHFLIIANVVIFIIQLSISGFTSLFALDSSRLLTEPWRIVTHMFLHANYAHLLVNMLGLFFFAPFVERTIGTKRFVFLYFGSGITAAILASLYYLLFFSTPFMGVGASGALMGVLGALILLMPNLQILLFFVIPMPLWLAGVLFFLYDFFGALMGSTRIGHEVHLVGLAFGLLFGWYLKKYARRVYKPSFKEKSKNGSGVIEVMDVDEWRKRNS